MLTPRLFRLAEVLGELGGDEGKTVKEYAQIWNEITAAYREGLIGADLYHALADVVEERCEHAIS